MKKAIYSPSIEIGGQVLPINAKRKLGCYEPILLATKQQFDAMLSHHVKVLFIRMDIRVPEYTETNQPMVQFMRRLIKRLKKSYKLSRVAYLWVREQNNAEVQHYHLWLMLDGGRVQYPSKVIKVMENIADTWGWPKPFTPKNCFRCFHRENFDQYKIAFQRASYLAKENSKGNRPPSTNDYSASRIKPRQNT